MSKSPTVLSNSHIFDGCFFQLHKLILDPVYAVPDPHGHDINFNSLKTRVALKFVIILQNLIKTNHRKSGKSKYDRKLTD